MANQCVIDVKGVSGTLSRRYSDEAVQERFRVKLDSATRSIVSVCNQARAANPTQFPLRGQAWPAEPSYGLYADSYQCDMINDLGKDWHVTVTYAPLRAGEPNTEGTNDNPLMWPTVWSLEWVEYEEAIVEARNVEAFTGAGHSRPALTLGPVVNSALQEFDEGIFKTVRRAVLVATKNVATLDELMAVERDYADTCNSDTVYGIGPRRYAYIGTDATGRLIANGFSYYPRTIRIKIEKTTDRALNNVGWHNLDFGGKLVKYKVQAADENGQATDPVTYEDPAEPGFLTMAGGRSTTATKVTYRYLTEVPYAGLLI